MKWVNYLLCPLWVFICVYEHGYGQHVSHDKEAMAFEAYSKARELGNTYIKEDSIFYYTARSNQLFKELSMDSMVIMTNLDLVFWYDFQGEVERARAILQESAAMINEDTGGFLKMLVNLSLARLYFEEPYLNIDSSLYYAEQAHIHARRLGDCVHEMVAIATQVEARLKDVKYLDDIPRLLKETSDIRDCNHETKNLMSFLQVDYGRYLMLKENYSEAIVEFEKILSGISDDDPKLQKYIIDFIADSHEALGNYKMANEKNLEAIYLIEKINEKEKIAAIQQAQAQFDSEQQQSQIKQLKITNELKERISLRQRILLWVVSIGFLAFLFLGVQYLRSSKKRIKSDEQLISFQNEVSEMKSKFYTNITHEFRTPLTVIMGLTSKLKGNFEEKVIIERNSKHLLTMVNQMLDLSKADAGALKLDMKQSNIIIYLEYLVESLVSVANKKQIRLVFHSSLKEVVMDYDTEKIRQVCYNLLSNALKFTSAGGKVILLAEIINQQLVLKFTDSGKGIPKDEIEHVFDRFYQVGSNEVGGTGIGLALVQEIVQLISGQIEISSELDVGTSITVRIPITNNAPLVENIAIQKNGAASVSNMPDPLTVQFANNDRIALIVEDNEDVATYIKKCVESEFKVLLASNGEEALLQAFQVIPDIIISDVMMPIMDGFRLTRLLKEDAKTSHIPIVLLTAKATKEEKLEGLQAGADAYMLKPFEEEELMVRIQKLTDLRIKLQNKFIKSENLKPNNTKDDFVERVMQLLEEKLSFEKYGVSELVHDLDLSRMQVHRKIKALTGMSTSEFINHYKLERAHSIIQEEALSLTEVAYMVGYSSPSYFSSLFNEKYGYEPSKLKG